MTTALARKFRLDVTSDLTLAAGWTQVKGLSAFKPAVNPNLIDTSSYDTNGWSSFDVTMQQWELTMSFWRRTVSGVYDVGQELIRARQGQFGDSARVGCRWYDTAGGPEAFSGVAIVEWDRANDGVKDVDAATVKLDGDGVLNIGITNPYAAAAVPVIISALPSGAAAGALITLSGANFTGLSALTIGGVSAPTRTVVSDQTVIFVVPAGSAGSAPIIATNGAGASASFPYTRA
jgi:hypothetical protein